MIDLIIGLIMWLLKVEICLSCSVAGVGQSVSITTNGDVRLFLTGSNSKPKAI